MLQDESAQWAAVQRAGVSVANAIYLDFQELQPLPEKFRTLALIGKGHNAADALIVCAQILADFPRASVTLLLTVEPESMKPLAKRAYDNLKGRVHIHLVGEDQDEAAIHALLSEDSKGNGYAMCIDGLLGM